MDTKSKTCLKCGELKPLQQFGRRRKLRAEAVDINEKLALIPKELCLLCEVEEERRELSAENKARKAEREKEEAKRAAEEEAARKKRVSAYQNEYKKKKRAKTKLEAAKQELLSRTLAQKSLLAFTKRFHPNYLAGWVHVDICNRLEKFVRDVEAKKSPRLMLFVPPRHGKSAIASQSFPAWGLMQHPEWEFIAASYGSSLPVKFSRAVRGQLRDPRYQVLAPETVLDKENENVEGWGTTSRGGYIPAGVGGGITGKGANILIIDDPVKDAEEADSEVTRNAVWDWYGSTAITRLAPENGVLVIQTRWHDDDLSGRLIQQMRDAYKEVDQMEREVMELIDQQLERDEIDAAKHQMMIADAQRGIRERMAEIDTWEIISYPAIAEYDEYLDPEGRNWFVDPDSGKPVVPDAIFVPKQLRDESTFNPDECRLLRKKGEALHPARYPLSQLNRRKNTMQPRHWHALFQQNPVPEDGEFFKKEQFRYHTGPISVGDKPVAIAWDLAVGKKQINDYTVGAVGVVDYNGDIQILDLFRGRWDTHEAAAMILETYTKYRKMTTSMCMVGIERGQLEMAIRPELNRLQDEKRVYPNYDNELKPLTDKLVRARPLQGYFQAGKVVLADPSLHQWVEVVQHELLRFPNGTFDDCVDALAWLVRMIERNFSRPVPKAARQRAALRKQKIMTVKERLRAELMKSGTGNDPMAA